MTSRGRLIAAVVAIGLAYALYRIVVHAGHVEPAIVTPQMDAVEAVSPSFLARIKRFVNDRVSYSDRANRPRLIALTFDDGPYPMFTPLLLEQLRRLHVPATFFLIGRDAQQWPELTQRIRAQGNEVANHTYTHPNLEQEPAAAVRAEIVDGRNVLQHIVPDPALSLYFRPPHGRYTVDTIRIAQSLGYTTVLWTDDSGDWRVVATPQILAEHLEAHATAPEIVLLHSGRLATVQMLPAVVSRFREAGYRFVTVSGLLARVSPAELNHPAKRGI